MAYHGNFTTGNVIPFNRHLHMLNIAAADFRMEEVARQSSLIFFENLIENAKGDSLQELLHFMQDPDAQRRHSTFRNDASFLTQDDRDRLIRRIVARQQDLHEE